MGMYKPEDLESGLCTTSKGKSSSSPRLQAMKIHATNTTPGMVHFNDPPAKESFIECWYPAMNSMKPKRLKIVNVDNGGRLMNMKKPCIRDLDPIPQSEEQKYHDVNSLVAAGQEWVNDVYRWIVADHISVK